MVASIIGWYGTETLGDRAIIDGIFCILSKLHSKNEIRIGSLFDFYTERTLQEDINIYTQYADETQISIFDSKNSKKLRENITSSDILIVGGGPLMDLEELYILRKSFIIAKRHHVPIIIMGCGIGPLNKENYVNVVKELLVMADEVLLRDEFSLQAANTLIGINNKIKLLGDPAVISIEYYKKKSEVNRSNYAAINFREYTPQEYGNECYYSIDIAREIIRCVQKHYEKVFLVPMHNFSIGGDDRKFLSQLVLNQKYDNVYVMHETMNLYKLYDVFANAEACIGMRYHSVVMQTLLNGNNFVLDYTSPSRGKISGFINSLENKEFYDNRIIKLQKPIGKDKYELINAILAGDRYTYTNFDMENEYADILKNYVV